MPDRSHQGWFRMQPVLGSGVDGRSLGAGALALRVVGLVCGVVEESVGVCDARRTVIGRDGDALAVHLPLGTDDMSPHCDLADAGTAVAKHALGAAADGSIVTAGTQASSSSRPPMPQWPEVYGCRTEKAESCRHRFVAEVTDTMKQPPGGTTSCVPMVRLLGACSRGATGECYSGVQQTT